MKGVLPWLVRWTSCAVQNIFFLTLHFFSLFVPIMELCRVVCIGICASGCHPTYVSDQKRCAFSFLWSTCSRGIIEVILYIYSRGLQRDVVYLGWPIAPSCTSPNAGGGGAVAGSQPMSTPVNRSPNRLWGYNSIFNL